MAETILADAPPGRAAALAASTSTAAALSECAS